MGCRLTATAAHDWRDASDHTAVRSGSGVAGVARQRLLHREVTSERLRRPPTALEDQESTAAHLQTSSPLAG
ncbi:hypothetical protein NDU88_002535 [Pleurodeles waltl]|uniref:Uncharacterized protein n=1 Tax=Pleurodeles waltl TaxID=8319 RepID=A0AAV7TKZ3_PLEWA|nr:hypothetical protein NDU88_002535 [Pleurodeles waltl]